MKKVSYIVRLDDASDYMSLDKWEAFFDIFDTYGVKPIVAVIPHVEDKKLIADHPFISDFWERVDAWQQKGYVIALHGYNHVYTTKKSGIIKKNQRSEFAGVSYKKQADKIKKGWQIFKEHGIVSKVFVAPAHSFDENTLKALRAETDIRMVSDGFTHDTFHYKGMYWIPQQISRPEEKESGVWTICYHPETAEQWQLYELKQFIAAHQEAFVNPDNISLSGYFSDSERKLFRDNQKKYIKKYRRETIKQTKHSIMSFLYQLKRTPIRIQKSLLETLSPILPDKLYIKWQYRLKMGKPLNLKHPKTFSEKLQWLKLYNRRPEYTMMVDKVKVKKYVASIIGEEYIIPTLGVWDDPDKIDFDALPDRFVLKCNHNSGLGMYICKDKSKMDVEKVKADLRLGLKESHYLHAREWPYKNVPHLILAEEYIEPRSETKDLPDYKWYCFNGEPTYCQVIQDRSSIETIDFFDTNWNHQDFVGLNPTAGPAAVVPSRPAKLETQIKIAKELSKCMPFSRIDLYQTDKKTYFGEITFFPMSGMGSFNPNKYNEILGNMISLPDKERGGNY